MCGLFVAYFYSFIAVIMFCQRFEFIVLYKEFYLAATCSVQVPHKHWLELMINLWWIMCRIQLTDKLLTVLVDYWSIVHYQFCDMAVWRCHYHLCPQGVRKKSCNFFFNTVIFIVLILVNALCLCFLIECEFWSWIV